MEADISNAYPAGNKAGYNSPIPPSPLSEKNSTSWESGSLEIEKPEEQEKEDHEEIELSIVYHYLTYDTELPIPSLITRGARSPLPPGYPDLSEYQNPFEWKESRKRWITWLSCVCTAATAFTAGAYSPGAAQMSREWHVSNVAILVGICTFTAGFAVAPMILAPFSEINGRRPVFIVTGLLFVHTIICRNACCTLLRWCRRLNLLDNGWWSR
jgi:hypothetical protein